MNLTIRFGCSERDGVPPAWWYAIDGWAIEGGPEGSGTAPDHLRTDTVAVAWCGLWKALAWIESVGGLGREDTLRLETAFQAVVNQLRGLWGATDHHAKALSAVKDALKRLKPAKCEVHHIFRGQTDAKDSGTQPAAESSPGKANPPTAAEWEAEVSRTLDLMEKGISSCCNAPIDMSRVIDRPKHRLHGHGPRTCTKCGKVLCVV